MGRENKKEAVASFHREQILKASEKLFSEKGYDQTTIEDISKMSGYSRRTVYVYYESKDDILHHIIENGLVLLKSEIEKAIEQNEDFFAQYRTICEAMKKYHNDCPHSSENIVKARTADIDIENLSDTVKNIFALGTQINNLLENFIEKGKENDIVRNDVVTGMTVYILQSGINSLFSLVQTKGEFITKQFGISENDFLEYGLKQIINSILQEKI